MLYVSALTSLSMWTLIECIGNIFLCSHGHATNSRAEDSEGGNDDAMQTLLVHPAWGGTRGGLKKYVELNGQGQPFRPMKEVLCINIKKYAKDFDPTTGWKWQPRSDWKRVL